MENACQDQPETDENMETDMSLQPGENTGTNDDENAEISDDENDVDPNDLRKLYVGNLRSIIDREFLIDYFNRYGQLEEAVVMVDPNTKKSRGFGFVTFVEAESVDEVQSSRPHILFEREVETRRAFAQEDSANNAAVRKLFVGGVRNLAPKQLYEYFRTFGNITSVSLARNHDSQKMKRRFAFVEFTDYDPVDKIILLKNHVVNGFKVSVSRPKPEVTQIKKPVPKPASSQRNGT